MGRSLEGKVALVTGASKGGTGTGTAVRFAAEGAKVAITARSEAGLDETMAQIEAVGGEGLKFVCDLGDPDGGRATLVARTEAAFGPLDILVNNAVAHTLKPVHEFTLDELRWYTEVNLWAPWEAMTQVIPGMRDRGRGWILNLTSFSGEYPPSHMPFPVKAKDGSSMYGATKAALNRLTIAAAAENEGVIAVNALTPQVAIMTPVIAAGSQYVTDTSIMEPVETMAEAALALCSCDPYELSGRIAYSVQLLLELQRPTYDFAGEQLIEGWQPADLPAHIHADERFHAGRGWPDVFDFHRPNTPYPDALRA